MTDNVPKPQDTGCTTIRLNSEGTTNGLLSRLVQWGYPVEYIENEGVYEVGRFSTNGRE